MKWIKFTLVLLCFSLLFVGSSCNKNNNPVINPHPYGYGWGRKVFWSSARNIDYPITVVTRNSKNQVIHSDGLGANKSYQDSILIESDNDPGCSLLASSCVFYTDTAGHYSYVATTKNGSNWSGNFDIVADNCHTIELQGSSHISIGNWQRVNAGLQGNSAGLIVNWNGATGAVTANPNNSCLQVGMTVWQNNNNANNTVDYLKTNPDCSGGIFITGKIAFDYIGSGEIKQNRITVDGIEYIKL